MSRPLVIAAAVAAVSAVLAAQAAPPKGHLVVVGGGGVPDVVLQKALSLAGGPSARIVIFPQASEEADTGDVSVAMWKKAGASDARWLTLKDPVADRRAVEAASLIWFPGGDQNNLMKAFAGTPIPDAIRARYLAGAVVGGTSAGAAVMSPIMLTGDADLQSITVGATKTAPGLGLWPGVIIDQHFLKRQRHSRTISTVMDHPDHVGVAIDERTAAIVSGSRFEVLGESSVMIFDARKAAVETRKPGQLGAVRGMTMHVLTNGMTFELQ